MTRNLHVQIIGFALNPLEVSRTESALQTKLIHVYFHFSGIKLALLTTKESKNKDNRQVCFGFFCLKTHF